MVTQEDKSRKNELLDRSRDILSDISSMTSVSLWMAAPDYSEILYVSPAFEKIYGLSSSDIYRNPRLLFDSTHPDDLRRTKKTIKDGKKSRYEIERRIIRPDGSTTWVLERVFSVKDERGSESCIVGFSEDITGRKNREIGLLESEKRYRTLIETSNDGIVVLQDDRMVFFNERIVEKTGFPREELSATPFHQFIHPDDFKMVAERYTRRLKTKAAEGSIEFRVLTKDRQVLYTEINAAMTQWEGKPALLCFFRDVTDQKTARQALEKSEERYRELVENIEDIIYVMDENGKLAFANNALLRLAALDPDKIQRANIVEMITPESYRRAKDIYKRQLNGQDVGAFEINFRNKKGEIITIETRERLIWKEGRVVGVHGIGRDVTQRKRTERALRESEERYRQLVEVSPDAVIVYSDGKIMYANPAAIDLIGVASAEELTGRNILDFVHPDYVDTIVESIQESLEADAPARMLEEKFVRTDGQIIDCEVVAMPLTYEGQPAMLVIARDVTARKKTEHALFVREQELNDIFEFTGTAMIIVNEDMTIVKCNQEFEQLVGYSKEEVEGNMTWTSFVHPDDLDRMVNYHKARRTGYAKAPPHYESRSIDRNGIIKNIYITIGFIPGTKQTVAAILDITDRKRSENALRESEEKLRNLFDTSKDVIFLSTITGWFYEINRAGEDLFGYTREELLMLDTQDVYKHVTDRQILHEAIERLGFVKDWDVTFKRKDGTLIDCMVTATLRKDREGNIIGYQGIIKDISERKRLEEQLISAKKMEAIGTLAGGMAHNFNNILVGIMGYSELLLRKKEPGNPDYKALSIIHEGTVSASKLTKELLSMARGGDYNLVRVNLNDLIERFLPLVTGVMDKQIQLKTYLSDDLPSVKGDMSQIQQCLLNLCINARDAMPGGGNLVIETYHQYLGEDFVRAHLGSRAGDYAVISVADTGEGITEENKPHIFEPFFSTKDHKRGTGLGLSTVWGTMKSHNGLITVYSEPNEGTTFKLYFPAVSGKPYQPSLVEDGQAAGDSGTILLIDDEPIVRETWSDALTERGFRVIVAEDGVQGLDVFRNEKDSIDLVILDFIMPRMGGGEAYRKLKELKPDVKVLISSGYGINGEVADSIGQGAAGFIQKPCQISGLIEKVDELINKL
ncbi:MAG: PAS domain S-box protein [Deltaproteobacteria bacterium]|nr:PAS domain S-box protein [Candidatus Zymogenaceae bacterium]